MTRVVLGSASPGRRHVLRQAGVEPLVLISGVDEDAVVAALGPDPAPKAVTAALATAKATRVAGILDPAVAADCVVIGCDSLLYVGDRLCGKPESAAAARAQWQLMAGTTGQLYTGHCLIRLRDNRIVHQGSETTATAVRFGMPSIDELDTYIDSGEPMRVAGGFTIDGLGGWFIDSVDGDPSAVIGIGLPTMRRLLKRAGLSLAVLWAANPVA